MLNRKKNNKGFTLVELLVVIAIIGILAVVAVPALFKNIEKGKVADLEADISAIRSAALSVYADTSTMPANEDILSTNSQINSDSKIAKELEGISDPFNANSYATSLSANGNDLILTIIMPNQISASGMKKLEQDLGDKLTEYNSGPSGTVKVILMSK